MKLAIDFYADGFRFAELTIDDEIDKILPKCKCRLFEREGHQCERGKMVEASVARLLHSKGIDAFPEIITCKRA